MTDEPKPFEVKAEHLAIVVNRQHQLLHATLDELREMKREFREIQVRLARTESRLRVVHWTVVLVVWATLFNFIWIRLSQ